MKIKKLTVILAILFFSIIAIGTVSAESPDNFTNDISTVSDGNSISEDSANVLNTIENVNTKNTENSVSQRNNEVSSVSNYGTDLEQNIKQINSDSISTSSDNTPDEISTYGADSYKINESNYNDYFNASGNLNNSNIISNDIFDFSGNFTNKNFTFNLPITITSTDNTAYFINGTFTFLENSTGSNISNLKFNNSNQKGTCVYINHANNISVLNNDFYASGSSGSGVYCYLSNYSNILNNKVTTTTEFDTAAWTHSAILIGGSNYINIANNNVTVGDSNGIYLSGFSGGNSNFCNITNNSIKSSIKIPSSWNYLIQLMGSNNSAINNTLTHGYLGISGGTNATIVGNNISDICGSYLAGKDDDAGAGQVGISCGENAVIANNTITNSKVSSAGIISGANATVSGNNISVNIPNTGNAIYISKSNGTIINNIINKTGNGSGINLTTSTSGNFIINNNTITTSKGNGIIVNSANQLVNQNEVKDNTITTNDDGIILQGKLNDTIVSGNIINSNNTGINLKTVSITNLAKPENTTFSNNNITAPIKISNKFILDDTTYSDYFDENGVLKSGIIGEDDEVIVGNLTNKTLIINQQINLNGNGKGTLTNSTITLGTEDETASGSTIKNLIINNENQNGIILNELTTFANIINNKISIVGNITGTILGIGAYGYTADNKISNNTIKISGNSSYNYGINVMGTLADFQTGSGNPENYNISNNKIEVITDNLSEGICTDSLLNAVIENNVITADSTTKDAYGIVSSDMSVWAPSLLSPNNITVKNNNISIKGNNMIYGVEFFGGKNIEILNNNIYANSTVGSFAIANSGTTNTKIKGNNITSIGNSTKTATPSDALGVGLSAIYITYNSENTTIEDNTIYTNSKSQINTTQSPDTTINKNNFVIDDSNYESYFSGTDSWGGIYKGELLNTSSVKAEDTIYFGNLTKGSYNYMIFNIPLNIKPYTDDSYIQYGTIQLNPDASGTNISNLNITGVTATHSTIILNQSSNNIIENLTIDLNTTNNVDWTMTAIHIYGDSNDNLITNNKITAYNGRDFNNGKNYLYYGIVINNYEDLTKGGDYLTNPQNNIITNNDITINSEYYVAGIYNSMANNTIIKNNTLNLKGDNLTYGIVNEYSQIFAKDDNSQTINTQIINNNINANGSMIYLIENYQGINTTTKDNHLIAEGDAVYGYAGYNTQNDQINNNYIVISGTNVNNTPSNNYDAIQGGHAGVYLTANSTNADIENNYIISNYQAGNDYGVLINQSCLNNKIANNYLVSDNGNKKGNDSVNASTSNEIYNNIPNTPTPINTSTIITANNLTINYKEPANFTAKITDGNGNVLSGKECMLILTNSLGESKTYWRTSNTEGIVKLGIGLIPGNWTITCYYPGDKTYNASNNSTGNISIIDTIPKMIANNLTINYKEPANFTAKLSYLNGTALGGRECKLILRNVLGENKTYDRTSNTDGIVKLEINLIPGTWTIEAYYPGDDNITESTHSIGTVIVN